MKPQTAIIKLANRLNKSSSADYDNIPDATAVEAIHKAALALVRDVLRGNNSDRTGEEQDRIRIDDIQFLLTAKVLKGRNNNLYFETDKLPEDYLYYSVLTPKVSKDSCKNVPLKSLYVEEANTRTLLSDEFNKPSFEWRETFHTLAGNKIKIYTNSEFIVDNVELVYYRLPKKMDINGYIHEDGTESVNRDLEFKDDVAEIIIDKAASIIAGDIESINQVEIISTRVKTDL